MLHKTVSQPAFFVIPSLPGVALCEAWDFDPGSKPLVPPELLHKSDKILFLTQLTLSDFVYVKAFFGAFVTQYPHIKIDVWLDERAGFWDRPQHRALYDWVHATGFFNNIFVHKKQAKQALLQNYPLVVSLAPLCAHRCARLARFIAPKAFIVGLASQVSVFNIFKKRAYKKLNKILPARGQNITSVTDLYVHWFEQLFGLHVCLEPRAPSIEIPKEWVLYAKLRFLKYNIGKKQKSFGKVFFINSFAVSPKKDWPLGNVVELIRAIKKDDQWRDVSIIVNAPPAQYKFVTDFFRDIGLNDVFVFSATENFFQLPAIISCCDLVVSVDSHEVHLAGALNIPVIPLGAASWQDVHAVTVKHGG